MQTARVPETAKAHAGASHAKAMHKELRCMHCGEVFTMNGNNGQACKGRYNEVDGWILSIHEVIMSHHNNLTLVPNSSVYARSRGCRQKKAAAMET